MSLHELLVVWGSGNSDLCDLIVLQVNFLELSTEARSNIQRPVETIAPKPPEIDR